LKEVVSAVEYTLVQVFTSESQLSYRTSSVPEKFSFTYSEL